MPANTVDCPICGTAMQKQVVADGIEIDFCDWHGVWLDAGELERLLAVRQPAMHDRPAGGHQGVGKAVVKGLAGAAVMGAGFHLGGRMVGGILDGLFGRRG